MNEIQQFISTLLHLSARYQVNRSHQILLHMRNVRICSTRKAVFIISDVIIYSCFTLKQQQNRISYGFYGGTNRCHPFESCGWHRPSCSTFSQSEERLIQLRQTSMLNTENRRHCQGNQVQKYTRNRNKNTIWPLSSFQRTGMKYQCRLRWQFQQEHFSVTITVRSKCSSKSQQISEKILRLFLNYFGWMIFRLLFDLGLTRQKNGNQ